MTRSARPRSAAELHTELSDLRDEIAAEGYETAARWDAYIHRRDFCLSAINLACYLSMRSRDLRSIQRELTLYGLSSLGRSESRVLASLDAVIASLAAIDGSFERPPHPASRTVLRGARMLKHNTARIFGPENWPGETRIMVTLPTEAADDMDFVRTLAVKGADSVRINCSHDNPDIWARMIDGVRSAERAIGRPIKILMDLGGPKPRTADRIAPKKTPMQVGDRMMLARAKPEKSDDVSFQARCTLPEVIDHLKVGRRVAIDDGKMELRVDALSPQGALLVVTHVPAEGYKLKDEKGINLPDTEVDLSPLQPADLEALDFVAHNADMIGYSFVQSGDDIAVLQRELEARLTDPTRVTIIAKIETPRAVLNLPEIIVRAAGRQPFGVMIARGDLAVELGFARTAEMQEEIMWLCEAASVPVIWATQVMESLVKTGTPTRGEMTDAAMSSRAECVMLNKGPYIRQGVEVLDGLLTRMTEHQNKKTPQLRALHSWRDLFDDTE